MHLHVLAMEIVLCFPQTMDFHSLFLTHGLLEISQFLKTENRTCSGKEERRSLHAIFFAIVSASRRKHMEIRGKKSWYVCIIPLCYPKPGKVVSQCSFCVLDCLLSFILTNTSLTTVCVLLLLRVIY